MSAEALRPGSADDLGLATLVRLLRRAGFAVSASEAGDATRLLLDLAVSEPQYSEHAALRGRLSPIFCKSREEQERFGAVFDEWLEHVRNVIAQRAQAPLATSIPIPKKMARAVEQSAWTRLIKRSRYLLPVVVVAAGLIYAAYLDQSQPEAVAQNTQPTATSGDKGAVATATSPLPQLETSKVEQYVPAVRYNRELRVSWAWTFLLLPLLAFLGISLPALVLSRMRLRRSSDPMYLNLNPLEASARRLVPAMRQDISDRLARHLYITGLDIEHMARRPVLDVRGTIEATERNRGVPTLKYSHSRVHPSYLLLIDVANQRDPRGRFFFQWAERMRREGLEVDIMSIRMEEVQGCPPAVVFAPMRTYRRPSTTWLPLARLPKPVFGQRLIVISDGNPLVDLEGVWRVAATRARFYRWRDRVMFTPIEPRDWGVREEAVERKERAADPGFIVLPLEESALGAWTDLVLSGQLSMVHLAEPQRFPALLRGARGAAYVTEEAPSVERLEQLMEQLRVYLGHWGLYWLAACAVPPLIRWELTLLLGEAILKGIPQLTTERAASEALARYYRRLVKLPWLQREGMPEWLRLRLLSELPPGRHKELQELVRQQLRALGREAGREGVALNFERPPGSVDSLEGGARSDTDVGKGDALYLGYVSGLTPEQLVLRAPAEWSRWTDRIRLRRPQGVRGWLARLREHTSAWWSRLAWNNGLPHLGLSKRSFAVALLLAMPLAAMAWMAFRDAADPKALIDRQFFKDSQHLVAWRTDAAGIVAISDDGSRVALRQFTALEIWDTATATQIADREDVAFYSLNSLHFTPDGKSLIGINSSGGVNRWDAQTLKEMDSPPQLTIPVPTAIDDAPWDQLPSDPRDAVVPDFEAFAYSGDGGVLLTREVGGTVRVWDAATHEPLRSPIEGEYTDSSMAVSHDGKVVVKFTGATGTIVDTRTADYLQGRAGSISLSGYTWTYPRFDAINVESDRIAVGNEHGLRIWNLAGDPIGPIIPAQKPITAVAFTPDGSRLVSADKEGTLRFWNAATGEPLGEPVAGHIGEVKTIAVSRNGLRMLTLTEKNEVEIWKAYPATRMTEPLRVPATIGAVAVSSDGALIAASAGNNEVRIWETHTRRGIAVVKLPAEALDLAFDANGSRIFVLTSNGLRSWDSHTGATFDTFGADNMSFRALAVSTARVAAIGYDGLRIWDIANGGVETTLPDVQGVGATFDPTGKWLLTVELPQKGQSIIQRRDASTGQPVAAPIRTDDVLSVAMSPDGTRIVSGHYRRVRLWDAASGSEVGPPMFSPSDDVVGFVAFTRDGARIVSAGSSTVRVWDAKSSEPIGSPINLPSIVDAALAEEDRQLIVAESPRPFAIGDDTISVWRLDPAFMPTAETTAETLELTAVALLGKNAVSLLIVGVALVALVLACLMPRLRRRRVIARLLAEHEPA